MKYIYIQSFGQQSLGLCANFWLHHAHPLEVQNRSKHMTGPLSTEWQLLLLEKKECLHVRVPQELGVLLPAEPLSLF